MNKQHILFVIPNFTIGGLEVRACGLINHFKNSFRYTVFSMNGDFAASDLIHKDVDIDYLYKPFTKRNLFKNLLLAKKLLNKIQPDIVMTYNWGSIEWVLANVIWKSSPVIHSEEGFGPEESIRQKKIRVFAKKIVLSRAFKVLVPSTLLKTIALSIWQLPPKKVQHLINGVDISRFSHHKKLSNGNCKIIIGTVATLRKEKNLGRLIDAFAQLKNKDLAELWIVGGGNELDFLEKKVAQHGLSDSIKFLGYQSEPSKFLSEMDIYAISSDTEQMPISLLEAMACGLPVVSTDVGDIRSMISSDNDQFIISKENPEKYVAALSQLIMNADLRRSIGDCNRKKCLEFFTVEKMFDSYEKIFKEALQKKCKNNS